MSSRRSARWARRPAAARRPPARRTPGGQGKRWRPAAARSPAAAAPCRTMDVSLMKIVDDWRTPPRQRRQKLYRPPRMGRRMAEWKGGLALALAILAGPTLALHTVAAQADTGTAVTTHLLED